MSRFKPKRIAAALALVLAAGYAAGYRADLPFDEVAARYETPGADMVEVDGVRLHYFDIGSGPTIVILHGSGADISAWQGVAEALAARGFRVVAFDMPGSGLSENAPAGDYSIAAESRIAFDFIAALDLAPAAVLGHSVGGQVAWTMALEQPETVGRLVLVAPTGYPQPSPLTWQLVQIPVLGEAMRKITPRFLVRMNIEDVFFDKSKISDDLVDRYYAMIRREGARDALMRKMRAVSFAGHEKIACITSPTLILWGADDAWLPPALGERFHAAIAGSTLTLGPAAGHELPEEAPANVVAGLVADWLASAPQPHPTDRENADVCASTAL
ncbi:MAG: alpha/beta fold hydrolase [Hyphomicrobiales bacterium]